jgi:uncharacterized protein with PQ loop repeat
MEIFGWLGGIFLSICAFPQVIKVSREKNADGMSHLNLWLWFFGEVFMLSYVLFHQFSLPLLLNYSLNLVFVAIMIYYKYLYGKTRKIKL